MKPGAQRFATEGGPAGIESVAFRNPDGALALVVLNRSDAAIDFTLAVSGQARACRVPAHGIQTYVGAASN